MGKSAQAPPATTFEFEGDLSLHKVTVEAIFDDPRESIADAYSLLGVDAHAKDIAEVTGFEEGMIREVMERGDFIGFLRKRVAEKSLDAFKLRERISGAIQQRLDQLDSDENIQILNAMHPADQVKYMLSLAKLERYRASTEEILLHHRATDDNKEPVRIASPKAALANLMASKVGQAFLERRAKQKALLSPEVEGAN